MLENNFVIDCDLFGEDADDNGDIDDDISIN